MQNKNLTFEELEYVQEELKENSKSLLVAYSLAVFLGSLGIHRAYFGKVKTALLKSMVSIGTLITTIMIISRMASVNLAAIMASLDSGASIFREFLAYNAVLAVFFILFTSTNIIWSTVDLFFIPRWKRKSDKKIKEEASNKVIKARYVSEHLLKEQLSKELIEESIKETVLRIERVIENSDEKELKKLYTYLLNDKEFKEENKSEIEENFLKEEIINDEENKPKVEENLSKEEVINDEVETSQSEVKKKEPNITETLNKESGKHLVKGFIIGRMNEESLEVERENLDRTKNVVLSDSKNEESNNIIIVKIPKEQKIKSNNLYDYVEVYGTIEKYFGQKGLKKASKFTIFEK